MARPVIALLTDFGVIDHYVAAMKGVILGICPDATLLDISHDVPPHDILAGALELEAVVRYLPAGTIVVAVVDPGVGSGRRGIGIEAGDRYFVGPDNGVFSLMLREFPAFRAVALAESRFARPTVSRTFEGRDRFAPAAAWLAAGARLAEMGPVVQDLVGLHVPEPSIRTGEIDGVVLRIDRFGNLVTNISGERLASLGGEVSIGVSEASILGVSGSYADAEAGALCAVIGSTERLEICVNGGNAATRLAASRGTPVHVRLRAGA